MQKIENLLNPNGKTYSSVFNSNFNGVKICLKRASSCLVPSSESSFVILAVYNVQNMTQYNLHDSWNIYIPMI